ncbi:MAG: CCA tRNA nucleotidyltransferase [Firmicutes bacterium]|nr:CCA tRNA nucleotidyltransferase [Bacillota bacterium]
MNIPKLPDDVKYILNKLHTNGYEGYIVGGCVRDAIMGIPPHDWDMTTSAKPEEVKSIFSHTFDTGIKHGTVTVVLNKNNYEITTYRIEGEYDDCRHPNDVSFTTDLHEDLLRRDFTMNAIAYNDEEGYVDIFGGIGDIDKCVIKGVGEAEERFREDALRMLRAVRFSAQLGFEIEEKTKQALIDNCALIEKISAERIREEITKLLMSKHSEKAVFLWETGLLKHISEEIDMSVKGHEEEVISSLKLSVKNVSVLFALFLRFVKAERVKDIMKDLRFDTKTLKETDIICRYMDKNVPESRVEIRKMASEMGKDNFALYLEAKKACGDALAENAQKELADIIEKNECLTIKELAVTGDDIKALGVKDGKKIGEILKAMLNTVLENPELNSKEKLTDIIKSNLE